MLHACLDTSLKSRSPKRPGKGAFAKPSDSICNLQQKTVLLIIEFIVLVRRGYYASTPPKLHDFSPGLTKYVETVTVRAPCLNFQMTRKYDTVRLFDIGKKPLVRLQEWESF